MKKIRVLIVDDSVVVRRMLTQVLEQDREIEVVGVAATGRIATAKVEQLKPDIVTMDSDMPDLDGVQMLLHLRRNYPHLRVILFSSPTEYGGTATLDGLSLGANDYVIKPSKNGGANESISRLRDTLIPKIKGLFKNQPLPVSTLNRPREAKKAPSQSKAPSNAAPEIAMSRRGRAIEVLAIGISTGGPNALAEMLPGLPDDFPIPILIVQHMPTIFTRMLADRLQAACNLKVRECIPGEALARGQVWIAPGGSHMALKREGSQIRLVTNQDPPENSCRPAVDVLFRSVAALYGASALAVVMTGMGQDGLRGCEAIRKVDGRVLAQDEPSSVVWGMPGAVATAGLAEQIVSLKDMAREITRIVMHSRKALSSSNSK